MLTRRPIPLMFIDGSPMFKRVPVVDDESTSVFVMEESSSEMERSEAAHEPLNPVIERKLKKIQTPFGSRIYQPLTFILNDGEEVSGFVERIEKDTIVIRSKNQEENSTVSIYKIQDVFWRGQSLSEI